MKNYKTLQQKLIIVRNEIKRRYTSVFENRSNDEILSDFTAGKWISKTELIRMYNYQYKLLATRLEQSERDYNDLTRSFNLNSLNNFNTALTHSLLHNKKVSL